VAHTLNALDNPQLSGLVSPKDKLMAMQIMIDHDLGYTLDAAKGDFGASKDHPLASAAYLEFGEQNSGIFTGPELDFMRDAVLKHSYPFGLDQPLKFSNDAEKMQSIANLISVIDAMGVTGDTKCPAIFREALNFDILANLVMGSNIKKKLEDEEKSILKDIRDIQSDPALTGPQKEVLLAPLEAKIEQLREQLRELRTAEAEAKQLMHDIIKAKMESGAISQDVAEGYHMAVDYDMSAFGGGMILPQFGGKLEGTRMERAGDENPNHFALHLDFGVSEDIRNLAAAFGGRDVVGAFKKMVKDLPFKPTAAEKRAAEAAGQEPPTVTNLGERAKVAEAGTQQDLTTGGAVRITLKKLQG
jgi:hypothetical protein